MSKTLSESAAEILQASMNAQKEPAAKLPAEMDDLGGQTPTTAPTDIGKKAADTVSPAAKPATKGDAKAAKTQAMEETEADETTEVVAEVTEEPATEEVVAEEEVTTEEVEQIDEVGGLVSAVKKYGEAGYTHDQAGSKETRAALSTAKKQMTAAAKERGIDPKRAMKVADRITMRGHGDDSYKTHRVGKMEEEVEVEISEEEEAIQANEAWKKDMVAKHKGSMKEDVDALFNGESLSEEFRSKATTIFEAAVNARIDSILEDIMTENETVLEEAVSAIKTDLAEQVDEYLNYVVEQWVEENQVAIETGLRAELVDDFISGLKNLFSEHYIEIPEEKVDVAEELAQRVAALEEAVTTAATEKAAIVEELNAAKKNEAIRKICEGLTEVQIGKMKSLAEGVEFTTEGDFNNKLATIRENYFPAKKVTSEVKALQETAVEEPEVAEIHGLMAHYVKAITKTAPKA